MRLVAAGRATEIFDLGDGRVLRRFKAGGDPEVEAAVMEHARRRGYPVPAVLSVSSDAVDVALSWVILATSGGRAGRVFLRSFLPHFDRSEVVQALPEAGAFRLADPNVTGAEREAVRRLLLTS